MEKNLVIKKEYFQTKTCTEDVDKRVFSFIGKKSLKRSRYVLIPSFVAGICMMVGLVGLLIRNQQRTILENQDKEQIQIAISLLEESIVEAENEITKN